MAFNRTRPNEVRPPEFIELPDGRRRLTRWFDLANGANITDALVDPWGTLDAGPATGVTAGFAGLRLVLQGIEIDPLTKQEAYKKTYETIDASAETAVGADDVSYDESGFKTVVADFVQFTTGGYVPGTVGVTTYGPDATCVLKTVEDDDDGTVRRIKRTFINGGILATDDQSLQGGNLLKKTITSVKTAPTTPGGYTLVGSPVQNPGGVPTYSYTFYKGTGTVDLGVQLKSGGKLVLYHTVGLGVAPTAPDATIGGTVTLTGDDVKQADGYTIYDYTWAEGFGEVSRGYDGTLTGMAGFDPTNLTSFIGILTETTKYLTAPTVTTNPVTSALTAPALISATPELQDGYKLWTVIYALGKGTIDLGVTKRFGGKLVLYHRIGLNAAPSAPSATIGGTVTLTDSTQKSGTRFENGSTVYDYTWVEGLGEVSRRFTNSKGGPTDFDPASPTASKGPVRCTIRYLTAASVTTDPTTPPASFKRVDAEDVEEDGYRSWTVTFGYGAGLIVDDVVKRHNGKLYLYHRIQLGSAPSAPSASISGTVVNIKDDVNQEDGYQVYDYEWAEGQGVIATRYVYHPGYLRTAVMQIFNTNSTLTAFVPSGGVAVNQEFEELDGATLYTLEVMQSANGDAPDANPVSYEKWMPFKYPGQAKLYTDSVAGGAGLGTVLIADMFLSPPIDVLVLATVTIKYSTSKTVGTLANALWNPTQYATLRAKFANSAGPRNIVRGLEGHTANGGATGTGTDGGSGLITVLGERIFPGASYSMSISGGPTMPNGSTTYTLHAEVEETPAFVDMSSGAQWYRHILIEATPAALPALPV